MNFNVLLLIGGDIIYGNSSNYAGVWTVYLEFIIREIYEIL
jgi:hypothetical protein